MAELVQLQCDDGIATIRLADAAHGNALGPEMSEALAQAVEDVAARGDVRVLRLTGTGASFCVGGDIRGMHAHADRLPEAIAAGLGPLNAAIQKLHDLPMPVVSTVNGSLGGGGIGLALTADLVVATRSAKLRGGYTAIGLVPDVGTSALLPRRVGEARARRILFLNEMLGSATCLDWGIYDFVYDDDTFETRSTALVEALANGATDALIRTKQLLRSAPQPSLTAQLARERDAMVAVTGGDEFLEGFSAFLEKRPPRFRG